MLPPRLRKFSELYDSYGLGAVKNIWLLTCLIPLARTVNLNKLKDYVGGVLENEDTQPGSHYKRLIRFFQDWGDCQDLLHDLMRHNLRFLRGLGFKTLVMDGTSWTIGEANVHYLVLSILVGSVAVPIYWVQLEKIGASNREERKAMFEAAFSLFNLQGMIPRPRDWLIGNILAKSGLSSSKRIRYILSYGFVWEIILKM